MKKKDEILSLGRPLREDRKKIQPMFEELEEHWRSEWWGMPEFAMGDAHPQYRITINFMTRQDVADFAKRTGLRLTHQSDSAWYPNQDRLDPGRYKYVGPPTDSRYPICIPSKGRADCQTVGKVLDRMGVSHRFFVEETEADQYMEHVGEDKVVSMPFHDLGQGSIPARNFIWEWAKEREHKRHWTVDDNIRAFARLHNNRRLYVIGGGFFRAMEDFVDRYENIAMAGPHAACFVSDRRQSEAPYLLNSRVYSCILLDTSLPHRWRGRYNEDTDLSLRLLKDGWVTLLFRALLMQKGGTAFSKNASPMKGGNTDFVYNTGDHRKEFAESLRKQHPDCVKITWKFNRWHHQVDYTKFKNNRLRLRADVVPIVAHDNYGMEMMEVKRPKERA